MKNTIPSYKQEEGVIYQARDLAVARAKLGECMVSWPARRRRSKRS
jgi:hypothetical protein